MSEIENKVVIITGGGSGIGAETAKSLAAKGASVVLGDINEDRAKSIAEEIGENAIWIQTDVTKRDDMEALAAAAIDKFGRIDVLVNNAGIMPITFLKNDHVDDWDLAIDINLKGVLNGIRAVVNHMLERGTGQVVNMSSGCGRVFFPGTAVYSATKAGVIAISEILRKECLGKIRVTVILPGAVGPTNLSDSNAANPDMEALGMIGNYVTGALPVSAVANAIVYAVGQPEDVVVNEIQLVSINQA